MRDLSQRIEQLTQELRGLRLQLQWTNSKAANAADYDRLLNHVLDAPLISDLTEVVNQLTQFLWRYIDTAAEPTSEADIALQNKRLEQATALLRRLRGATSLMPAEDPAAFVARVTRMVDRLLLSSGGEVEHAVDEETIGLERPA